MRTKWGLSAGAFEKLLHALSPDREIAGQRYETIRASLLPFFTRRAGSVAESLVDETIDRVCRRVERGDTFDRPTAYFHGVARYVLREHVKAERRHEWLHRAAAHEHAEPDAGDVRNGERGTPEKVGCLHRCLRSLDDADQALIRGYYGSPSDDASTIGDSRAQLARELGISPGNLRLRAFRARRCLEECYRHCLARTTTPPVAAHARRP